MQPVSSYDIVYLTSDSAPTFSLTAKSETQLVRITPKDVPRSFDFQHGSLGMKPLGCGKLQ